MAIFLLSFDLNHEDGYEHYSDFTDELTKLRGFRVMNNACLVSVNTSNPKRLLDHLRPMLEDTDRIFAVRVAQDHAYYLHAYPGTNEWLKRHKYDEEKLVPAKPGA